jgi:hypothetical protein
MNSREAIEDVKRAIKKEFRNRRTDVSESFFSRCQNSDFNDSEEIQNLRTTREALLIAEDICLDLLPRFI